MRLSIMAMLALGLSVLYHRYHLSPEKEELLHYGEYDVPAIKKVADPLTDRLGALLTDRRGKPEEVRRILIEELIPGFVRVRTLAAAPVAARKTPAVQALAKEYLEVVDAYLDACRTAVRAIDAPTLDPKEGLLLVQGSFGKAVSKESTWAGHVRAAANLSLAPKSPLHY